MSFKNDPVRVLQPTTEGLVLKLHLASGYSSISSFKSDKYSRFPEELFLAAEKHHLEGST